MNRIAAAFMPALALLMAPVAAHHSDSVYFHDDRDDARGAVKISGTITRVRLINPHSEFLVAVTGDDGETAEWAIESDSWNELRRLGWTQDSLQEGEVVDIVVSMSRFHDTAGRLRDMLVHHADGETATLYLEYIPDASDEYGQSNAPLAVLERAPRCEGTVQFDPVRERGEETLLCISLDAQTPESLRADFADELAILR